MSGSAIKEVASRRVWDSRGNPTVEVDVHLESGAMGRSIAPAGASRGAREAFDLRDGGDFLAGKNVSRAVENVIKRIAPAIIGMDCDDLAMIDRTMIDLDGSQFKSSLGGNAMVATSLACLHASAANAGVPLWAWISKAYDRKPAIPLPEIQIFGGGAHAAQRVDIQDFMIMVPGAESFDEVMEITSNVYFAAGRLMSEKVGSGGLGVADEGGWWPVFNSNEEALETLVRAIEAAGEVPGERVLISLDVAASEFGKKGRYRLALDDRDMDSDGFNELLGRWMEDYPIVSIEDPLGEDDKMGMIAFTKAYGHKVQIIGDDYLVTNADLVREAVSEGACNAVLVKLNQAGTVSETIETVVAAEGAGYRPVISARSGETEDTTISHLSVGLNCKQLKVGSFTRSERMAKWNECLRIECDLGAGSFVGGNPLADTWWGKRR
ncbi:phosphopyruvate hydratase [Nitratireductor kimnyeongensis]|uniref:Enolase n=1 Tax=Nitratireductor kimnyeongensis TaxID=430679 RepID=A0ABW0T771_9HYPH|nr:phosphopyruvate hydratase [Nitratireductor kimnyeongensis]QZZ36453.1 phosphopyruvate hydratase [Nitratireductor kimnyeongensis]